MAVLRAQMFITYIAFIDLCTVSSLDKYFIARALEFFQIKPYIRYYLLPYSFSILY